MADESPSQILEKISNLYPNDKFRQNEFSLKDKGKTWYFTMNSLNNCFETLNEVVASENLDVKSENINMEKMEKIRKGIGSNPLRGPCPSDIFWPGDREFQTPEIGKPENFISQSAKERALFYYKKYLNLFRDKKNKVLKELKRKNK